MRMPGRLACLLPVWLAPADCSTACWPQRDHNTAALQGCCQVASQWFASHCAVAMHLYMHVHAMHCWPSTCHALLAQHMPCTAGPAHAMGCWHNTQLNSSRPLLAFSSSTAEPSPQESMHHCSVIASAIQRLAPPVGQSALGSRSASCWAPRLVACSLTCYALPCSTKATCCTYSMLSLH
jgi:hypothetical protein